MNKTIFEVIIVGVVASTMIVSTVLAGLHTAAGASDASPNQSGKWLKEKLKETAQKIRDSVNEERGPGCPVKGSKLCGGGNK
jgi:hypothetical protein